MFLKISGDTAHEIWAYSDIGIDLDDPWMLGSFDAC